MRLTELLKSQIEMPGTRYFIIDTGRGYEDDTDFITYSWDRHRNNKIRSGDLFIYRKPGKLSATRQFYFYGCGQFENITSDDNVVASIINSYEFEQPIRQADLEDFRWEWKERYDSWEHFWNQYGINEVTRNDYHRLLSLLDRDDYNPQEEAVVKEARKRIKKQDYFVDDVQAMAKVRPWQREWSHIVKESYGWRCAMCDISDPGFLVGSHIIPVKDTSHKHDRANPANGLCLCVLHDKVFDKGYLSIDKTFAIIFSSAIDKQGYLYKVLSSITNDKIRLPKEYRPEQAFLDYHHKRVFLG